MTEPLRPIGPRPAVQPPGAAERVYGTHRRRREEDEHERREQQGEQHDPPRDDDAPAGDGHIDVLA